LQLIKIAITELAGKDHIMPASASQTAARLLSNHGEFIQRMTAKRFRLSRILCDSSIYVTFNCLSVSLLTFLPFASFSICRKCLHNRRILKSASLREEDAEKVDPSSSLDVRQARARALILKTGFGR
jgi:hypothetical protein